MNTTTEILTVNGVVLNTLAKNIETLAGRLRTPAKRTENIVVPGAHGALRVPNKNFDQNHIALPMWVVGCDDSGNIPTGSNKRIEFYKRVDELTKLFKGSDAELHVQHTLPDGSVREIFGDCMEVFDWTTTASPKGQFTAVILCSYPFWQDDEDRTQNWAVLGKTSVNATKFAQATAPMEDMRYELTGPWLNAELTFGDGSLVAYDANIPAGQGLIIDSGEWELTGIGGLVPDYTAIRHDGVDSRWATLPADTQEIGLAGSSWTSATELTMTGRRKYLVG